MNNKTKTIDEYLAQHNLKNETDPIGISLRRYLPDYLKCQDCGSDKNIHIHHKNYPARSMSDIEILCASCHNNKHKNGLNYLQQQDIYYDHKCGVSTKELAIKHQVSAQLINKICLKFSKNDFNIQPNAHVTRLVKG
jgi:hypothetical protein